MEYCKHGTLDDVLHTIRNGAHKYQIEPATTLKWMRQVAAGLGFLHAKRVCHRDLKSSNVLVDKQKECQICDYGVSKLMDLSTTSSGVEKASASPTQPGTTEYMPPEALGATPDGSMPQEELPFALDVYSYGVLLNEMASRRRPWAEIPASAGKQYAIINRVVHECKRPQLPPHLEPAFQGLLEECWTKSPGARPRFDGGIIERLGALSRYQAAPEPEPESAE